MTYNNHHQWAPPPPQLMWLFKLFILPFHHHWRCETAIQVRLLRDKEHIVQNIPSNMQSQREGFWLTSRIQRSRITLLCRYSQPPRYFILCFPYTPISSRSLVHVNLNLKKLSSQGEENLFQLVTDAGHVRCHKVSYLRSSRHPSFTRIRHFLMKIRTFSYLYSETTLA